MATDLGKDARERGGCLTLWLVVATIGNGLGLLGAIGLIAQSGQSWISLLSASLGIASFGCVVAIWMWKKWGIYGYGVAMVLSIVVSLVTGLYYAVAGVIGLTVFAYAVLTRMDEFD
jgi:hypothetical protein